MRKSLLVLLCLCFGVMAIAQRTVMGTITDNDGEALIGASVLVKGTTVGTVTDFDGKYSVVVPEGSNTLVVSYTGYATQEIELGASNVVDVSLAEGVVLNEAVVTALGIERDEKALGYAVQSVDGGDLDKARETNVVKSLGGRIAGVQVNSSSNLGGSAKIIIRGNGSILGDNQPLFVVDGVPLDNSNFTTPNLRRGAGGYDYGNAAQDINPDDVESINVLKGAAATALYGSRGANGVIVVTTKKGSARKGIGVSINSGISFQEVAILPDYQNRYGGGAGPVFDTLENGNLIPDYGYDGSWGPALDGQNVRHWDSWFNDENFGETRPWSANPSNVEDFFRTGVTSNQSIALDGGNEAVQFRLSYTNLYQLGTQENSELKRNTINLNLSSKLSDRLSATASANYVATEGLGRPITGYGESIMSQFNQWFQRQLDMDRLRNYKNADGSHRTWNPNDAVNGDLTPHYWDNPFWERYENFQDDNRDRLFGNVGVSFKLAEGLSLEGRAGTDFYTDERRERVAVGGVRIPKYSEDVRRVAETNLDLFLKYNSYITPDFNLTAFVGGTRRDNSYERNYGSTRDGLNVPGLYTIQNSTGDFDVIDYHELKRVNSVYGSASFGYKNYLYLDVTGRNDWSSALPEENNSYFYPSASLSFVFSELMNTNALSFGKLRLNWAQVGNDTDPYRTSVTYLPHNNFGSNPVFSVPNALNNEDLRPEKTTSYEVGLDLRFFQNRLGLDISYYDALTEDLIFNVKQSSGSGYTSRILNAGEVSNKGIELALNVTPVKQGNFQWDIGLNFGQNKNELVELYADPESGVEVTSITMTSLFGVQLRAEVGQPLWTFYGTDYTYENGQKVVGANGRYIPTAPTSIGNTQPDFTGGVNTTLSFGGLSLYALVDFQEGGTLHSYSNQWGKYSGILTETAVGDIRENGVIVDGVYAEGTMIDGQDVSGQQNETRIGAPTHFFVNQGYVIHAADQYDASFIKLREARLTYDFNPNLFNGFVQGLSLSVVGRNLALLSSEVDHIDPEDAVSTSNIQGFEGGQLPSERSIGLNLNVKF